MKFLALLICLSSFAADVPKPPYISVTGDAEVKATPDQFTVRIRIDGRHKEQASAREQVDSTVQRAVAAAKILGVAEKDIRTLYFQTRRVFGKDGRTASVKSYEVSSRMSFVLRDVNKAEELVNALTDAGASVVEGSDFGFANPRKHYDQARTEAVGAATQKANAVAQQLGVKVGFPLVVDVQPNESTSPLNSRSFANVALLSAGVASPSGASEPVIAPGEITIRASVRIEFELLKP